MDRARIDTKKANWPKAYRHQLEHEARERASHPFTRFNFVCLRIGALDSGTSSGEEGNPRRRRAMSETPLFLKRSQ